MQINITQFYREACPMDYAASVVEIGQNAGRDTWQAAKEDANDWNMLNTDEKRQAFREWVKETGGWDDEGIAAWSNLELNALFVQWVAGDIRECLEWDCEDVWTNYAEMSQAGQVPSNLWRDDQGQVFFSLDH